MKADASSAMFIVLDAHNRTMAKNYVQGTLLDRFVECILSARKSGLAVRQGMKQAMKKCDDMYMLFATQRQARSSRVTTLLPTLRRLSASQLPPVSRHFKAGPVTTECCMLQ